MLTKMRNKMRMTWGRTHTSKTAKLPMLNPADLTRSSWAKPIRSYADVPDIYKEFFDSFHMEAGAFPYSVLTPTYERFIHKTTEKLICDLGYDIYVLEKNGNTLEKRCYPVNGISYVEIRTALLASSFKICGMTDKGVNTSSTLKFNSVTDYLFAPILKKIRLAPVDSEHVDQNAELAKFDSLMDVNFKFMNLAKHSLLEEEKVIHFIIQSEIQERLLTFLGKTYYRTISPTHISIMTDRELIVIREDEARQKDDRYGGIWDYIPKGKITSLSMSEKSGDLLGLTVQLSEDTGFELLFQTSTKEELNVFLEGFEDLIQR